MLFPSPPVAKGVVSGIFPQGPNRLLSPPPDGFFVALGDSPRRDPLAVDGESVGTIPSSKDNNNNTPSHHQRPCSCRPIFRYRLILEYYISVLFILYSYFHETTLMRLIAEYSTFQGYIIILRTANISVFTKLGGRRRPKLYVFNLCL